MEKFAHLVAFSIILALSGCTKETQCTSEDQNKWQDQETFKQSLIEKGYRINELKVTEGNCYEIYGWNENDQKVEIYFNPVDGSKVKEEIH
jgi:hypothetical protein